MANLERREQSPGKVTYRVRWWADGKQRSKSFKRHDEARRFKAVLEGDMVNGSYIDPKSGTVTLSVFAEESLPALIVDVRPSTAARIQSVYKVHIEPEFGHLPLTAITGAAVSAWMLRMLSQYSPASVRKNVHVLRRVLDQAVNNGLLRVNPAMTVRLPKEEKHEQRYLTHGQAWTLADTINPRFRAMVLISVFGGLRYGEVAGLQRRHIDGNRNTIHVRQTLVEIGSTLTLGPPKTKTSVRVVTVPRSIMAEILEHLEAYVPSDPDALLFTGEKGQALSRNWWYRYYWQRAAKAAGLEGLRFHDLRHTFVALWVDLGRNPKEVSRAAGHSSVAFTLDRYGHLYDTDHDGLADELDAMLQGHTRTHVQSPTTATRESRLPRVRPPSSSGLGRRPFTAVARVESETDSPPDGGSNPQNLDDNRSH